MRVTAKATRSGDWWAIEVPEVPGAFTQVKRLDQATEAAAEAVSDLLEVDVAKVEVELAPVLAPDLLRAVKAAREAGQAAVAAQAKASAAMRQAVAVLRNQAAFSVRDAAALLGISHQRVAQLEAGEKPTARNDNGRIASINATTSNRPMKTVTTRQSKNGRIVRTTTRTAAAKVSRGAAAPAAKKRTSSKG